MQEIERPEKMTHEEHRERHVLLHRMADELFADFIRHHPKEHGFLDRPIKEVVEWSHKQTVDPDEDQHGTS